MTGYGRAKVSEAGWDIQVDIKSVNHRYFEFSAKLPKTFLFLEDSLKRMAQQTVTRGKVELLLSASSSDGRDVEVEIDRGAAGNYLSALRQAAGELELEDDLKLSHLLRFNDIFVVKKAELDEEAVRAVVEKAAAEALASYQSMREREGQRLKEDVLSRLAVIGTLLSTIEARAPQLREEYYERLYQKIAELLADSAPDEGRLVTEAAVFAEKVAVDEETVRLRSHMHQFETLLQEGGPVGKKLDFLVQELNRETNTIGSKAQDVTIARIVVDIKAEIEKIREQIQNIE